MGQEKLTDAQLNAIHAPIDKPLMILAAAGSGKTLVLCHRILHLISQGVSQKDILAVTFTRRAGQDLLYRLERLGAAQKHSIEVSSRAVGIRVGTFHSFCLSVLRAYPNHAGLAPDFVVFTPKMQLDLLESLIEEWHMKRSLDGQSIHFHDKLATSKKLQGRYHSVAEKNSIFKHGAYRLLQHLHKAQFGKLQEVVKDADLIWNERDGISEKILQQYHERLLQENGIDFNSFIRYTINVLQKWPSALESAGLKTQYIFVDEFQDTDVGQFELLRILCKEHGHITIVGDDDQQIYSWHGAAGFQNIKKFENAFVGVTIIKLEQNFRSTGAIVASARSLITKNKNRIPKTVRTVAPTGMLMTICECRNVQCEATAVGDFILSLKQQGVPLQEIAILYRLQRIGLEVQHNLQAWGIECHIRGSGSGSSGSQVFLGNGEEVDLVFGDVFHDILAVLRAATCESDELGSKRLLNLFCPSMSLVIRDCLSYLQLKKGFSLLQAIKSTWSHLVGLLTCSELSSHASAKSMSNMSKSDCVTLDGMNSILKLIAATKNDSKHMSLRDIIFNILQQISCVRSSQDVQHISNPESDGNKVKNHQYLSPSHKVETRLHKNLEYAGIKALLKEAALFDGETASDSKSRNCVASKERNIAAHQRSYMDMKQKRSIGRRSATSVDKPGILETVGSRIEGNLEKLKIFLDQVNLKMHDNELGENNGFKSSSLNEAVSCSLAGTTGVTLSTIHQAKGLEWTAVILVRANEGVIPLMDDDFIVEPSCPRTIDHGIIYKADVIRKETGTESNTSKDGISVLGPSISEAQGNFSNGPNRGVEEERRLMYVALTRAKRFVLVTHIVTAGGQQMAPSRFLADIPQGLVRRTTCYESKTPLPVSVTSSPTSTKMLQSTNHESDSDDSDFERPLRNGRKRNANSQSAESKK
ncbi:hypothetical protein SUGI_0050450 [Cryptomeria japonica]|nr:hypothetical protein SUGI_0050450 [Cryptomeria japonica]